MQRRTSLPSAARAIGRRGSATRTGCSWGRRSGGEADAATPRRRERSRMTMAMTSSVFWCPA